MWLFKPGKQVATYCDQCGVETDNKHLCKQCNRRDVNLYMYYCDGCGEDYPKTHLLYDVRFDGHFCDRCHTPDWRHDE